MSDPKQFQALVDAIRRYLDWQENMRRLREEQRQKRRRKREQVQEPPISQEDSQ